MIPRRPVLAVPAWECVSAVAWCASRMLGIFLYRFLPASMPGDARPHKPAIQPIAQPAVDRLMLTASSVRGVEVSNYFSQSLCS